MTPAVPGPQRGTATGWTRLTAEEQQRKAEADALWHQILAEGLPFLLERQAESPPTEPGAACVYCFRAFGPEVRRNRMNRYYCDDCDTFIRSTPGQAEIVAPCLVVDVRNATGIEQSLGADWVPAVRRFRRSATGVIQRHYGFVMNSAGAFLTAVFPPGFLPLHERGSTNVTAQAIEAAETLAAASPPAYVGGGLPYGVAVHTDALLLFSVRGDTDDADFAADEGEFDPAWEPAPEDGPVSIDVAGDAVFVATELAGIAAGGEALVTWDSDVAAGAEGDSSAYQETRTKAATVSVRSVRPHGGGGSGGRTPIPSGRGKVSTPKASRHPHGAPTRETDRLNRLSAALQGRYCVQREVGQGGMAVVYLAEDLKHGRPVALKVLKSEASEAIGVQRFLAEIRTTAKLQHPRILPLHDSGEADGLLYYVMPYVTGETLRDRMDRERFLSVAEGVGIAVSVARALAYAHGRGVIHRDVKPANILIQDGEPVVADFGIALSAGAEARDRMTSAGVRIGTLSYMSPEQATGEGPVGPASDIYSLGCILYEMLCGDPPFTGSATAVLAKMLTQRPLGIREVRTAVPAAVEAEVERAMSRVPADRHASADAFADALAAALRGP